MIHASPHADLEIPDVTITAHVLRRALALPNRTAIRTVAGDVAYTFAELQTAIHSFAGGLSQRGFAPGSVLGLMAPNMPEYPIVFHGAAVAGGMVTTINPAYGVSEVRQQLRDAGATVLVASPSCLATAVAAAEGTAIAHVLVLDNSPAPAPLNGVSPWRTWFGPPCEQVPVDVRTQTAALPYSSGTTGLPKGVMLTHRNLVASIVQWGPAIHFGDDEVGLAFLPFFHIYGLQVLMNTLLANGATVVTMERFEMKAALEAIQALKVTRVFAVPPIILGLATLPMVRDYDLSSIRLLFSAAAPLGAELAAEASARIGCEVVQGYGMSELSPGSHTTALGDFRPGTSGTTVPNTQTRIVAIESGENLPVGKPGEVWVRGPQVMKGYLNNPEATAAMIDGDGWLRTGDIGIMDEHGHLTIVDRLKELIKFKGFQIAPAELEALILTHPKVADVAVVGVPDAESGEVPKAFIVPRPGQTVTLEEIQELIGDHLARYKQIRSIELITEIPKSASGKILRRKLLKAV
jgi:acyl-CoA synthetase (AMP-forming)/AMP-acid ligase II